MAEIKDDCPKCHGHRQIKEIGGTIHICYECLQKGRMDMHDTTFLDHKIRL